MGSTPTLGTNFFSVVYRHYYPPFGIEFERDNGYLVRCVAHSEVSVETRIALLNNDWSSAAGQLLTLMNPTISDAILIQKKGLVRA